MTPHVEMIKVKTDSLSVDGENPNEMPPEKLEALKKSIQTYGFAVPIVTNRDLVIADGEHRWTAAKELGLKKVPVAKLDLEDVDRRILRQVLNKLSGSHDAERDLDEFKQIEEENRIQLLEDLLGKEKDSIATILANTQTVTEDTEYTEEDARETYNADTEIELGDVYELGPHRLVVGSCTEPRAFQALMEDEEADLVFTDPPYGVSYDPTTNKGASKKGYHMVIGDDLRNEELYEFLLKAFKLTRKHTKEVSNWYVCSPSTKQAYNILASIEDNGVNVQSMIIWAKNHFNLGRNDYHWQHECIWYGYTGKNHYWCGDRTQSTVWNIQKDKTEDYEHPTQKPLAIPARAIQNSTKKGAIILDPFGGSGSTLIATQQHQDRKRGGDTLIASNETQRKARLIELDPAYAQVILDRWNRYVDNNEGEKSLYARLAYNYKKTQT